MIIRVSDNEEKLEFRFSFCSYLAICKTKSGNPYQSELMTPNSVRGSDANWT